MCFYDNQQEQYQVSFMIAENYEFQSVISQQQS